MSCYHNVKTGTAAWWTCTSCGENGGTLKEGSVIRGECATCSTMFNVLGNCPTCAEGKAEAPVPHVLNDSATACRHDCDACYWLKEQKPDVDELERMFQLEDPRG